ncbi:MAG: ribonuclease D [Acidimicrobiales bacterium]
MSKFRRAHSLPTTHHTDVHTLVSTDKELDDLVASACNADRYAIDTEFHRERTYFPQVALIQMAWDDQLVLIDPLDVDLKPLAKLLEGDGLCVVHAGVQDLEVLDLSCGTIPKRIFDTQIAAGFLGVPTASLSSLHDRFLGFSLPKGDRLTDWLRRPLTEDQMKYAASDVEHLLKLTDILQGQLEDLGRVEWAFEECELLKDRPRNRRVPEDAILRIKEARSLKGQAYRVATATAAWREQRAAESNTPVRQVLSDLGIVAIAQQAPTTTDKLRGLRGVESRHLRDGADNEILTAVQVGIRMSPSERQPPRAPELPRHLRPVVTLVTAWIAQLARDHQLDPALLATRADVESLLKKDPESRLTKGWRQDLVGKPIAQLVGGEAAVAFDGDGNLVLEARSGKSLPT